MIAYKAKLYGANHGMGGAPDYDQRSSTHICSGPIDDPVFPYCWQTVSKELSAEWHHCPYCGYAAKRKHNAARVILIRALYGGGPVPAGAKRGNSPVCPVNTAGLSAQTGRRPSGLHPTRSDRPLEAVPSG